jgi:three-Cys-motif partner protein
VAKSRFSSSQAVEDDGLLIPEVGNWSEHKYALLANYCGIFTGGMKGKWNLVYIDLFAGAGYARIRETGAITKTSALLALGTKKPYDLYLINELDTERYAALVERCQQHGDGRTYRTFNLNANTGVEEILKSVPDFANGRGNLMFCFLDPFSLNLEFETVRTLGRHKVDLMVLLALQMDARRNLIYYIREESDKIERFLGDPGWRDKFAQRQQTPTEFMKFLSDEYDERMRSLGYKTEVPKVPIKTDSGVGLYYLAFYSKHERGGDFWEKIRKTATDQYTMF